MQASGASHGQGNAMHVNERASARRSFCSKLDAKFGCAQSCTFACVRGSSIALARASACCCALMCLECAVAPRCVCACVLLCISCVCVCVVGKSEREFPDG